MKNFILLVTALSDTQQNQSDAGEQIDARPNEPSNEHQPLQTERNKESQASQPEEIKLDLDTVPVNRFRNNNANKIITLLDSNVVPGPSGEALARPLVPRLVPTERPIIYKARYEDVEMTYANSFPKPFNRTPLSIMKRQNDIFSGNMPFNVTVIDWLSTIYKYLMKTYFILEKISHI